MVIDHKRKFIFIHVFRTGGTSIDWAFGRRDRHETHQKLETIPNWEEYFSFGCIRNPWDRMVSAYMFLTKSNKFRGSFKQYIETFGVGEKRFTKQYAQHEMVKNCSFIMRFEHLQSDLDEVCEHIGIKAPKLQQIWKTQHKPYKQMFDEDMKRIVLSACLGDINTYGFTFDSTATENIGLRK